MKRNFLSLIAFLAQSFLWNLPLFSQSHSETHEIDWQVTKNFQFPHSDFQNFLNFPGASQLREQPAIPYYTQSFKLGGPGTLKSAVLPEKWTPVSASEYAEAGMLAALLPSAFAEKTWIGTEGDDYRGFVRFAPLRRNPVTGALEKMTKFTVIAELVPEAKPQKAATGALHKKGFSSSVLKSGDWFKLGVTESGIHRIDYGMLQRLGMNPSGIRKKDIRFYGKKGGMLPILNRDARDSDLVENPIFVSGNGEDNFGTGDYILFYGEGPTVWKYNEGAKRFAHTVNIYSDTSYYFITASLGAGRRIESRKQNGTAVLTVNSYNAYALHELDQPTEITRNVKGGREWFGEAFDKVLSYSFNFSFPDRAAGAPVYLRTAVAARSFRASTFTFRMNGTEFKNTVGAAGGNWPYDDYAIPAGSVFSYTGSGNDFNVSVSYAKSESNSLGWLNFLELHTRSNLHLRNGHILFRDTATRKLAGAVAYELTGANGNTQVWDVTDFHNPVRLEGTLDNGKLRFFASDDDNAVKMLREFVAFDGSRLLTPVSFGRIHNQDLHAMDQPDMVILAHPAFREAANKVADFHRHRDGLDVAIVTPQAIYNEFGSGAQDPSAIRDFMRMFHERRKADPSVKKMRYLLLLGDASYDYKNRVKTNTNYVPTFYGAESFSFIGSFCADDYFVCLDPNEGDMEDVNANLLDIAVGRFPVNTPEQANAMADKIYKYVDSRSMNDWRNLITFASDDEDGNAYVEGNDRLVETYLKKTYPTFNYDKIYLDAYKQVSTSAGHRYPDATKANNDRMNKGGLVWCYQGHGQELGLAHEKFIQVEDVINWKNPYAMPLMVTATCEFSRFDDPDRTSAGEMSATSAKGGAIAMLTTTRVVNAGGNDQLNNQIFRNNIFRLDNGRPRRLGDIFAEAKNRIGIDANTRNFCLLGDPALELALPLDTVVTTKINRREVTSGRKDTLRALTQVTVEGYIRSRNGHVDSNFNGTLYPTVFDKEQTYKTLANDPSNSYVQPFKVQKSIIYKGEATVKNGHWTFSFFVPKDISLTNSAGKISYYATNGMQDAAGTNRDIVLGGSSNMSNNGEGPRMKLYINDTHFVSGGITDQNPTLLAYLSDDEGINTVGNGIGHEMTGVLNGGEPIIMNEYYIANRDDYRQGILRYPFADLADGSYRLSLKVWDVANNPAEGDIDFVVTSDRSLTLGKIFNYPNPFNSSIGGTTFSFEHNNPEETLTAEIYITNMRGQIVKTIRAVPQNGGYRIRTIHWNGTDDGSAPMAPGVYNYRLVVRNSHGQEAYATERLVIFR